MHLDVVVKVLASQVRVYGYRVSMQLFLSNRIQLVKANVLRKLGLITSNLKVPNRQSALSKRMD